MNTIVSKIEDEVLKALTIDKNGLYIWLTDNTIKNTKNEEIHANLLKIRGILESSKYCDRTPAEMWKEYYPTSELFDTDLFDLHVMYLECFKSEFAYLIDQLIHSQVWNSKQISTISIFVEKVYPIFVVEDGYKKGAKSNYWYDSQVYAEWKDGLRLNIDFIKKEIKKLRKAVEND